MHDTLQVYYDKHGRLPVDPIPDEVKECKDNKALKVFSEEDIKFIHKTKMFVK